MNNEVFTTTTDDSGKSVTALENRVTGVAEQTSTPSPKVVAATVGAGVGAAVSTLGVYLIETIGGIDLPETVEGAILVIVSAAVSFALGYLKRPAG